MQHDLGERLKRGHEYTVELHRRRNGDPPPKPKPPHDSGMNEAEVVSTSDLVAVVGAWGQMQDDENWQDLLAEKAGFDARFLRKMMKGKGAKYTTLRNADRLLTAMGWSFAFHSHLTVIPNPRWSMEHYHEYMSERGCW